MAKQENMQEQHKKAVEQAGEIQERRAANERTQEQPPVTIETVETVPAEQTPVESVTEMTPQTMPSGMVGTVVDSARAAASAAAEATEDSYIFNEQTQEMRVVKARAGYAPAPMPFGFRLATADEIAKHKAG